MTTWPGWRVVLRPDGQVRLEAACGANYGTYARGTFDCDLTPSFGRMERLAIIYDPQEGEGVWRLYRNAHLIGTLSNGFSPVGTDSSFTGTSYLPVPFVIGADMSDSVLDVRLTRAVLGSEDLLRDRGTLVLFR